MKKNILLIISFIICLSLITGCGGNKLNTVPNIVSGNAGLNINVEWPQKNAINSAPPSYLNISTIEVYLVEKDLASGLWGDSLFDYLDYMNNLDYEQYYYSPTQINVPDYSSLISVLDGDEQKIYSYSFDVTASSEYKDGATLNGINAAKYVLFLFGVDNLGYTSVYTIKEAIVEEGNTNDVNIDEYDWISNISASTSSLYFTSANAVYTTTTPLSLDSSSTVNITETMVSSFDIEYSFQYTGNVSDLKLIASITKVSGIGTSPTVAPTITQPMISYNSGSSYTAYFSIDNISSVDISSGFTTYSINYQAYEEISGVSTGVSDYSGFTLTINDIY